MPWRIPESELERIKRETDLLALVRSRGIELEARHERFYRAVSVPRRPEQTQLHRLARERVVALHGVREGGQRHPVCAAA